MQETKITTLESIQNIDIIHTFKEGIILKEIEVTRSDQKPNIRELRKIIESPEVISRQNVITITEDDSLIHKILLNDFTKNCPGDWFNKVITSGEWIFILLFNKTLVAYKRHKEVWKLDIKEYLTDDKLRFLSASEGRVVICDYNTITIVRNGHIIQYSSDHGNAILSAVELYDGSFIISYRTSSIDIPFLLVVISKEGIELRRQSIEPIQAITGFNDGILILYEPGSKFESYIKWYKRDTTELHCDGFYKTQYSANARAGIFGVATYNNSVLVDRTCDMTIFNSQLQPIVEVDFGMLYASGIIYGDKLVIGHTDVCEYGVLQVTSICVTQPTLISEDTTTLYKKCSNVYSSHFRETFHYMDSILSFEDYTIYVLATHWNKQNNFLQLKKNRDTIKTLYVMQRYGAFCTPKDVLDLIVTLAFSIMP